MKANPLYHLPNRPKPLRYRKHRKGVEHAFILAEDARLACFFVGFLEEKVVGLEDFV